MVRQMMLIEKAESYDFGSDVPYQEQEQEFRKNFIGAVNQALATLPDAAAQFNQSIDKALVSFGMQGGLYADDLPDKGEIVASTVTRGGISSGDIGMVLGVDQSPIGPLAVVNFSTEHGFVYAAMQLGEIHATFTTASSADQYDEFYDYHDAEDDYPF